MAASHEAQTRAGAATPSQFESWPLRLVDATVCVYRHNLRAVHLSVDAAKRLVDELQDSAGALVGRTNETFSPIMEQ